MITSGDYLVLEASGDLLPTRIVDDSGEGESR
jgi:hypothetical protein